MPKTDEPVYIIITVRESGTIQQIVDQWMVTNIVENNEFEDVDGVIPVGTELKIRLDQP